MFFCKVKNDDHIPPPFTARPNDEQIVDASPYDIPKINRKISGRRSSTCVIENVPKF